MKSKILKTAVRVVHVILITLVTLVVILLISLKLITSNISFYAKSLFVTTMLETGSLKFLPSVFLSPEQILEAVEANSMKDFDVEEDLNLIEIATEDLDKVEIIPVAGKSFAAKMMIVNDPSRVKLSTIPSWSRTGLGEELHKLVKRADALAGVNAGAYDQGNVNRGGWPEGIVVQDGKVTFNELRSGLHLIGFDENNFLRIIDLRNKNKQEIEDIVKTEKIRDAVSWLDGTTDKENHFVKLIMNGVEREVDGRGSGANPRTAIGQREDGAVLILVTDGRGKDAHLGATAKDLIKIMKEFGAVNAANLDGGSSSAMYYDDAYEMTSVTGYYSNSSWKLPTAWVVEKR
jgi:exopolysaccharide biosynthesis protein